MAKVTLDSISSGFADIDLLNSNFSAIATAIENTLSRNGTSPNAMSSNLDMNSNRILNLAQPASGSDIATKSYVDALIAAIASNNTPTPQKFNGGSQTYTLSTAVDSSDILVFLDGAVQIAEDAYEILGGTTLSFHTTTPSGTNNIVVVYLTDNNFSTVTPDNSVDTDKIVNAAVTNAKLANDSVNGSKIADNSIDSEHYVDGSIDNEHLADSAVNTAELADNAVTLDKIADAVFVTESEGISSNDNDTTLPTSAAVKDYVDTTITNSNGITKYSGATVHSNVMPTSYTDLDLSSIVGANRALVYLSVAADVGANISFRPNGETLVGPNTGAATAYGAGTASVTNNGTGKIIYVLVLTGTDGIVEWISSAAGTTTTVKLLTYTKL